jgi:uncharacterized protein YndB with AHSA1/START domain
VNRHFRIAPVKREIVVAAGCAEAFNFFALSIDVWWPKHLATGTPPVVSMHLEPMLGGRFWKQLASGESLHIGQVTAWEPPHHIVIAWQLGSDRTLVSLERSSEVEITFQSVDGGTHVELEHRNFENLGADGRPTRNAVASGWATVLPTFAASVKSLR